MGVLDNLRAIITGRTQAIAQKAAPYVFMRADGKQPAWQMTDFVGYVNKGYETNSLIYSAIMYKVRAAGLTRMMAYTGDPEQPERLPVSHPLAKVLARPNVHQSWLEFEGLNVAYLNLAGNAYVYVDRDSRGKVKALYPLRPDRVFIIPEERGIKGFVYVPVGKTIDNGVPLLPDMVMHVKLPNPGDEYEGMGYGMAPLKPSSQSVEVDNDVTRFLRKFFSNGAMVQGILKFNMQISPEVADEARAKWRERYGGSNNWGDVGVLDEGADYQKIGTDFKEMGFETIDERNEARVLSPLGVPGILLDTRIAMKSSTYANKAEARKAFWEDTFTYELAIWDVEYAYYLNSDQAFVQRDMSKVPALQKNTPELVDSIVKLWSVGMPLNQAMGTVGLRHEKVEGGDVAYLPNTVSAVGVAPVTAQESNVGSATAESETRALVNGRAAKLLMGEDVLTVEKVADWCVMARFMDTETIERYQEMVSAKNGSMNVIASSDLHLTLAYGTGYQHQVEAALPSTPPAMAVLVDRIDQFETPDGYAIHLRVRLDGTLQTMQGALVQAMQREGVVMSPYSLDYKPHITLAYSPTPIEPMDITPFALVVDTLEVSNGDYEIIHAVALKTLEAPNTGRWNDEQKAAMWEELDALAVKHEPAAREAAAGAFEQDRRAVMAAVAGAQEKAYQLKQTVDFEDIEPELNRYFLTTGAAGWRSRFNPVFVAVVGDMGNYWSAATGFRFDVRNLMGEAWFVDYLLKFADPINATTQSTIHDILARGQAEGWSIKQMQDAMGLTFDQWVKGNVDAATYAFAADRLPPHRLEMIARTETTRIQNAGANALFDSWGVETREWLSTPDGRTRDTHRAVNGQRRATGVPFSVGGYDMMHPGDSSLGAAVGEIVNCRCTVVPVIE